MERFLVRIIPLNIFRCLIIYFPFKLKCGGPVFILFWLLFGIQSYLESEKAMAAHSRTLSWKIPWTEEPGRLQSMGSLRVGHDGATLLSLFTFMHWRRK